MKHIAVLLLWILIPISRLSLLNALKNHDQKPSENEDNPFKCSSTPLHLAIGLVRTLVEQGKDLEVVDCDGNTPRDIAIKGNIKEVIQLLPPETESRSLNEKECFSTALHYALLSVNSLIQHGDSLKVLDCQNLTPLDFANLSSNKIVLALSQNVEDNTDSCNRTRLHLAVIDKDNFQLQHLLSMKENMYATDCEGMTPMELAVVENNLEAMLSFAKAQYDVNKNSHNLLTLAISKGSPETLKLLLDLGINKDAIKKDNFLLIEALLLNKSNILKLLLNDSAEVSFIHNHRSALVHKFSEEGNVIGLLELKKLNLLNSELLNTVNQKNETPLAEAVKGNYPAVLNILLANGANATKCTGNGKTCLHLAIEHGNLDALRTFLNSGLPVDTKDTDGVSSILQAVRNDDVAFMDILKTFGADLNQTFGIHKNSLLHEAAKSGSIKALGWLLNNNHSVDERNIENFTALHNAARYCKLSAVKELLSRKANIHAVTNYHDTPLHWAAVCGDLKVVQEIISNGGDVKNKCEGRNGWTPLHLAVRDGHLEVAKELLLKGADINAVNKVGHTPLYYATEGKHNVLIDYLKSMNGKLV